MNLYLFAIAATARFFCADDAPEAVASLRRTAFKQLSELFATRFARSAGLTGDVAKSVSDMQFTARYSVPFQFSRRVREHLAGGSFLKASRGTGLIDLDGNQFYDLAGSYGVLREVLQAWWSGSSSTPPSVTSAIGSMSSPRSNASGAR